jgi:hypothetical protein
LAVPIEAVGSFLPFCSACRTSGGAALWHATNLWRAALIAEQREYQARIEARREVRRLRARVKALEATASLAA